MLAVELFKNWGRSLPKSSLAPGWPVHGWQARRDVSQVREYPRCSRRRCACCRCCRPFRLCCCWHHRLHCWRPHRPAGSARCLRRAADRMIEESSLNLLGESGLFGGWSVDTHAHHIQQEVTRSAAAAAQAVAAGRGTASTAAWTTSQASSSEAQEPFE